MTEAEVNRITLLLRGGSNEEKIAGIMLSVKLLEMEKLDQEESKIFITGMYSLISPDFLIKLMRNTEKRRLFRQASMSLIACSIQLGFSFVYRDFGPRLLDLLFSSLSFSANLRISQSATEISSFSSADGQFDKQFELDLLLTLKWIAAESDHKTIELILTHSLKLAGLIKTEQPVYFYSSFLDFTVDLSQLLSCGSTSSGRSKETLQLSVSSRKDLRNLIVKGFHGGAPEVIRDSSLLFCRQFISSSSPVNTVWTVEETEYNSAETTNEADNAKNTGKFAMLLVSIIGVEVHLLLEEALALFKSPQGDPETPSYGDLRDPSEDRRKRYNEVNIDPDGNYSVLRVNRLLKMIPCCMSLLNSVLGLLVGREISDTPDTPLTPDWAFLPSSAMLHIRQSVHNIFQKIFDFLKEISDISQTIIINVFDGGADKNTNTSRVEDISKSQRNDCLLIYIVQQVSAALCLWVLEDEDLRDPLVRHLPLMLTWSAVTLHLGDSDSTHTATTNSTADLMISPAAVWTALTGSSNALSHLGESSVGDVLHYLLPCLASISNSITAEDEIADRICTVTGGCLISRLVNIALLIGRNASNLRAEDESAMSMRKCQRNSEPQVQNSIDSAAAFARTCHTCCAALDQLSFLLSWKLKDICTLQKGESETEALTAVFALSAETFPRIPSAAPFSLSMGGRAAEDRHAERLADILAVASGVIRGDGSDKSHLPISESLSALDAAISNLVLVLSSICMG